MDTEGFVLLSLTVCGVSALSLLVYGSLYMQATFAWHKISASTFPKLFSRSLLPSVSPAMLLVYRAVCFLYCGTIAAFYMERDFMFYTMWNYTILALYFGCATAYSVFFAGGVHDSEPVVTSGFGDGRPSITTVERRQDEPLNCATLLARTAWVLYQICFTMVFLVDGLVWTVLYPQAVSAGHPEMMINFPSFNMHLINLPLIVGDFIMNSLPYSFPITALFLVMLSCFYAFCSWLYWLSHGVWEYFFQDTSHPTAILWYAAIMLLHILFAYLCSLLYRAKTRWLSPKSESQYFALEDEGAGDNSQKL